MAALLLEAAHGAVRVRDLRQFDAVQAGRGIEERELAGVAILPALDRREARGIEAKGLRIERGRGFVVVDQVRRFVDEADQADGGAPRLRGEHHPHPRRLVRFDEHLVALFAPGDLVVREARTESGERRRGEAGREDALPPLVQVLLNETFAVWLEQLELTDTRLHNGAAGAE